MSVRPLEHLHSMPIHDVSERENTADRSRSRADKGIHDADVEQLMEFVGARSNRELAEFFKVGRAAVSVWRRRGVPKHIQRRCDHIRRQSALRTANLGADQMFEGLRLALWLAPSVDSIGHRFGYAAFDDIHNNYALFFFEIRQACAELIDDYMTGANVTPAAAFEALKCLDPQRLLDEVIEHVMRMPEPDPGDSNPATTPRETPSFPRRPYRKGNVPSKTERHAALILELIEQNDDISLSEIREGMAQRGVSISINALWRFFERRNLPRRRTR